jgi:hypothetical protein
MKIPHRGGNRGRSPVLKRAVAAGKSLFELDHGARQCAAEIALRSVVNTMPLLITSFASWASARRAE